MHYLHSAVTEWILVDRRVSIFHAAASPAQKAEDRMKVPGALENVCLTHRQVIVALNWESRWLRVKYACWKKGGGGGGRREEGGGGAGGEMYSVILYKSMYMYIL